MQRARSAVVPFMFVAVFLSTVPMTQAFEGWVEIQVARPNWKHHAGRCVLAPLSCSATRDVLCSRAEKKFIKQAQEILPVDGPEKIRSAFLGRSMQEPTSAEVLAIAREIGYDSVMFADTELWWEDHVVLGVDPVTKGPSVIGVDPVSGKSTVSDTREDLRGRTRLFLKTIDGVVLVEAEAEGTGTTPGRFTRKQLLNILKTAEKHEQGK